MPEGASAEQVLGLTDQLLDLLPIGVYVCDREGLIVRFNRRAAELWGCVPRLGDPASRYCGSFRLYGVDGTIIAHADCPMSGVLKTGRPVREGRIMIGRPDGSQILAEVDIDALKDAAGTVVGAVNCFREITRRRQDADDAAQRLAAIVESSDDAIVSKNLDGVIESWNAGAERLFGYSADEVIGKPVTILIPADQQDEEPTILARLRRGERVDHYETVRRRKDGTLVDISLTVSPVRDAEGRIVGASKIARDITERRRAAERQDLLLREMNHRVKNLFALAGSLVGLSARSAQTPREMAATVRGRLEALSRAQELTLPDVLQGERDGQTTTTLQALLRTILSPYEHGEAGARIVLTGPEVTIGGRTITSLALLLHEFATNAAKYGALSDPAGRLDVRWTVQSAGLSMLWTERGAAQPPDALTKWEGFGSMLARTIVDGQLGGSLSREWNADGLIIRLAVPLPRLAA